MNDISKELIDEKTAPEELGQVDLMNTYFALDPNFIPSQRIEGLIFSLVVLVGALVGLGIKYFYGGFDTIFVILSLVATIICAYLFVLAIVWPAISYRRIRWRLTRTGFEIIRGVIWRHQVSIPTARVQHADVSQGPLQRWFHLGTLTIHTAGTQNSAVRIDGMHHTTAMQLRDAIIRQRKASDVV